MRAAILFLNIIQNNKDRNIGCTFTAGLILISLKLILKRVATIINSEYSRLEPEFVDELVFYRNQITYPTNKKAPATTGAFLFILPIFNPSPHQMNFEDHS